MVFEELADDIQLSAAMSGIFKAEGITLPLSESITTTIDKMRASLTLQSCCANRLHLFFYLRFLRKTLGGEVGQWLLNVDIWKRCGHSYSHDTTTLLKQFEERFVLGQTTSKIEKVKWDRKAQMLQIIEETEQPSKSAAPVKSPSTVVPVVLLDDEVTNVCKGDSKVKTILDDLRLYLEAANRSQIKTEKTPRQSLGGLHSSKKTRDCVLVDASSLDELQGHVASMTKATWDAWLKSDDFTQLCQHQVFSETYAERPISEKNFHNFRVLGKGAFGLVNAVLKQDTGIMFAQKNLNKKLVKDKRSEKLCIHEKQALQQVRSKFVVGLHYSYQTKDTLVLVITLCQGGDLQYHLDNTDNGFAKPLAQYYIASIILGLEAMHDKSLVYLDLKPENVLLDKAGHCVISDLGLCTRMDKGPIKLHSGTPGYWSPEVICGDKCLYEPDIWTVGVCLFMFLTQHLPWSDRYRKTDENTVAVCKECELPAAFVAKLEKRKAEAEKLKADKDTTAGKSLKRREKIDGLNKIALSAEVIIPPGILTPDEVDFISRCLTRDKGQRIGCAPHNDTDAVPSSIKLLKEHAYFKDFKWAKLASGEMQPLWRPPEAINAESTFDIGLHDTDKLEALTPEDEKQWEDWEYISKTRGAEEVLQYVATLETTPVPKSKENAHASGCGCVLL